MFRYGGTESFVVYLVAPVLLVACLVAFGVGPFPRSLADTAVTVVFGVLLIQVALLPSLRAYGYLFVALGAGAWIIVGSAPVERRRPTALRALGLLSGLGAAQLVFAILQLSGWAPRFHPTGVVSGSFINPNHFGGYVALSIVIGAGLLCARARGRQSPHLLAAAIGLGLLSVATVAASGSAGAVLACSLALVTFVALAWIGSRPAAGVKIVGITTVVVLLLLAAMAPLVSREVLQEGGRSMIYRDTLELIGENWLLGIGAGMFRWRYLEHQSANYDDRYDHAHNDLLEHLAEFGVPLGLMLWLFLGWRLWVVLRLALTPGHRDRLVFCGAAAGLIGLHFHSLFDFDLHILGTWLSFMLVHASVHALEPRVVTKRSRRFVRGASVIAGALVVLVVLLALVATTSRLRASLGLERASRLSGLERLGALERAASLDPTNGLAHSALSESVMRVSEDLDRAAVHAEKAVESNPYHWRYRRDLARLYRRLGRFTEAEEQYRRAVALAPRVATYGSYHSELGAFLLAQEDQQGAFAAFGRAVVLDPTLTDRIYRLLRVLEVDEAAIDTIWPPDGAARLYLERARLATR